MSGYVEVTTVSKRLRHYAETRAMRASASGGQRGHTTCSGHLAHDQAWVDAAMPTGWRKRTVIAELPLCKRCAKAVAKAVTS